MIITISRQVSSNGELIGRLVAERLGLRYFDRELVNELARRLAVDPEMVDRYDESTLNPVQSVLLEWTANINEQAYLHSLRQALHRLAEEEHAVIIGRGANYLLSCPDCLHVRIIAPLALRVAIFRAVHDVSEQEAERSIRQGDRERAQFVRRLYREDIDDPGHYDLVVNRAAIPPEMAAEIIAETAKRHAAQPFPAELRATLPEHIRVMVRHRRPVRPAMIEPEGGEPG